MLHLRSSDVILDSLRTHLLRHESNLGQTRVVVSIVRIHLLLIVVGIHTVRLLVLDALRQLLT